MSKEKNLHLKFIGEVCGKVLTSKPIRGKDDQPLRVALFDMTTGQVVQSGPESSAKVELLVSDEHICSHANLNNRIIKEIDKASPKPHFANPVYIQLNEGIGTLCNTTKFTQRSKWTKACKCRLGARLVDNFSGIKVQEAWTEPFTVSDNRNALYKKRHPPLLSDPVWRLEKIGKGGAPSKRLNENNVSTVGQFLFLHSIDPKRLQKIVSAGANSWKVMVDHARTCVIDDNRIYAYIPSSEGKMGVVFDVVGGLKGLVDDSQYIPKEHLSQDQEDCANKLLRSAFENWNDITFFGDETALLNQFPPRGSYFASNLEGNHGCDFSEPGTSYQSITPSINSWLPNMNPRGQSSDLDLLFEMFGDNESLMAVMAGTHCRQRSKAGGIRLRKAVAVLLWIFRARKGRRVSKKRRT